MATTDTLFIPSQWALHFLSSIFQSVQALLPSESLIPRAQNHAKTTRNVVIFFLAFYFLFFIFINFSRVFHEKFQGLRNLERLKKAYHFEVNRWAGRWGTPLKFLNLWLQTRYDVHQSLVFLEEIAPEFFQLHHLPNLVINFPIRKSAELCYRMVIPQVECTWNNEVPLFLSSYFHNELTSYNTHAIAQSLFWPADNQIIKILQQAQNKNDDHVHTALD